MSQDWYDPQHPCLDATDLKEPRTWKHISTPIRLGVRATKQLLYLWFCSLSLSRRRRIVKEITKKVQP